MKKLYIEHANTPLKREKGLMGRKKMGKNQGMLFDFPYSRRLSFWMRNTYLPLDIAFINEDGIITEIKEMIPMSTRPVTSSQSCKYALEVNKGWFRDNNITEGASVLGTGIQFKSSSKRIAQMTPQTLPEDIPVEPGLETPPGSEESPQQEPLMPDIIVDKTHREILDEAELRGEDVIILYQPKESPGKPTLVIGPKTISPPFIYEPDEDGNTDAIVKAWDNQDAGWKNFLIDNIIDIERKQPVEEIEQNLIQKQEI
jgi:uncharacterized membrane protein (UPF0127 family)